MSSEPGRGKRTGLKILVALTVTVVLLELGLRVRQWARYGTVGNLIQLETHPSGLEVPRSGDHGPIHVNSLGFRGPEIELPKPARRIRLAFLGGSTTFCAQSSGDETTWPHLLIESLRADHPGVEFDYVNGAVPGYTTVQSLANLEQRVVPLDPDVLIVYHATNDLTHESRELAFEQGLVDSDEGSRLGATWSLTWNLIFKNLLYRSRQEDPKQGKLEFDPVELSRTFRENVRRLLASGKKNTALTAIATFSHRARRSQSPEEQKAACGSSFYYMPFMSAPGLLDAFEAFNVVIREEARQSGALLIEEEDTILPDATCFTDSVHFTDEGCRLMAARVQRALEASEAFQELLAARE